MLKEGQVIGSRYRLDTVLHAGGGGIVWTATDSQSGRRVALKVLCSTLPDSAATAQWFRQRSRAASNPVHPTFVRVEDIGQTDEGLPFLVTSLLDGISLRQTLTQKGTLSPPDAVAIIRSTLEALTVAHQQGVAHGNLKPENLFLPTPGTRESPLRILNFGLSRPMLAESNATVPQKILNSLDYIPPERLQKPGSDPTPAADVYACGVMLYEMLTGQVPLAPLHPDDPAVESKLVERNNYFISGHPLPIPTQMLPNLSSQLIDVIQRATAVQPAHRLGNASQLQTILTQAIAADPDIMTAGSEKKGKESLPPAKSQGIALDKTMVAGDNEDRNTVLFDSKIDSASPPGELEYEVEKTIQSDVIPDDSSQPPPREVTFNEHFTADDLLDEGEEEEEPPYGYAQTMVLESLSTPPPAAPISPSAPTPSVPPPPSAAPTPPAPPPSQALSFDHARTQILGRDAPPPIRPATSPAAPPSTMPSRPVPGPPLGPGTQQSGIAKTMVLDPDAGDASTMLLDHSRSKYQAALTPASASTGRPQPTPMPTPTPQTPPHGHAAGWTGGYSPQVGAFTPSTRQPWTPNWQQPMGSGGFTTGPQIQQPQSDHRKLIIALIVGLIFTLFLIVGTLVVVGVTYL